MTKSSERNENNAGVFAVWMFLVGCACWFGLNAYWLGWAGAVTHFFGAAFNVWVLVAEVVIALIHPVVGIVFSMLTPFVYIVFKGVMQHHRVAWYVALGVNIVVLIALISIGVLTYKAEIFMRRLLKKPNGEASVADKPEDDCTRP